MTYSGSRKEEVVNVFNVGKSNGEKTLAQAFGTRDVGMYILNSDLNALQGKDAQNRETTISQGPKTKLSERLQESRMPIVQTLGDIAGAFGL